MPPHCLIIVANPLVEKKHAVYETYNTLYLFEHHSQYKSQKDLNISLKLACTRKAKKKNKHTSAPRYL